MKQPSAVDKTVDDDRAKWRRKNELVFYKYVLYHRFACFIIDKPALM